MNDGTLPKNQTSRGATSSFETVAGDMSLGDRPRAAGAAAIGVTWGYHPGAALGQAGAFALLDDFAALVPALDKLWTL